MINKQLCLLFDRRALENISSLEKKHNEEVEKVHKEIKELKKAAERLLCYIS